MSRPYAMFGRALREAMASSGYTVIRLGEEAGYSPQRLSDARMGKILPTEPKLLALATVLESPRLVRVAHEYLKRTCVLCGVTFYQERRGIREAKFCSEKHRAQYHNRQAVRRKKDERPDRLRSLARQNKSLRRQIDDLRSERSEALAIIARFCDDCEPGGVCRMASCGMRDLSPLPLADERVRVA